MNDNIKMVTAKMITQLSSPWDWFSVGCGAVAGIFLYSGPELSISTSVGLGACLGLTLEKMLIAAFQHAVLNKKAKNLRNNILMNPFSPEMTLVLMRLDAEHQLWEDGLCSDSEFRIQLGKLIQYFKLIREYKRNIPANRLPKEFRI